MGLVEYVLPFLLILTVLVFVHEMGHFWVARRCGVRVEVFSIGFGPELFGRTDSHGTRWKFSAIPLGGYVRFFGDTDAASSGAVDGATMTPEERAVSFPHKRLSQRTAIVAAGPAANFLFAFVLAAALFMTAGQPFTPPVVGDVLPESAAADAGIRAGDRFVEINGRSIDRFEDIQGVVQIRPGVPLPTVVERDGEQLSFELTPRRVEREDRFGNIQAFGQIGIQRSGMETVRQDPLTATVAAAEHVWASSDMILTVVWQMITGSRDTNELGGVIRIAHLSGEVAQVSWIAVANFMILLSINLGLINLFPVPMLDGGHLVFYAAEAIRGRPLGERAQEYGVRIGFAVVVGLMLFATWNDLVHFQVVNFVRQLVS